MTLRARMLLAIVTIIGVAIGSFYGIAHYLISREALNKELGLVSALADEEAERIGRMGLATLGGNGAYADTLKPSSGAKTHVDLLIVDGKIVELSRSLSEFFQSNDYQPIVAGLMEEHNESGLVRFAEHEYLWVKSKIGNSDMALLTVHRRSNLSIVTQQKLFYRLIIVAAIIIWLSAWVVMMMTTRLGRSMEAQRRQLEYRTNYDELTHLPNRANFTQRLVSAIEDARHAQKNLALFLVDINRLKDINDTLGFKAGDSMLEQVVDHLRGVLRTGDTIGRVGGDEFAIIVHAGQMGDTSMLAERLIKSFDMPLVFDGNLLKIEISIGIALFPEHGENAETLLHHAEAAVEKAKETVSGYDYYDLSNDPVTKKRLELISDLHIAIETDQLKLHYQPKFDLDSKTLYGAEALLRWDHVEKGSISPAEFVPLAEGSFLITPLTLWVVENALAECARWHRLGLDLVVAVNLSARNIHDDELPERIYEMLKKHDLEPSSLILEITETAIVTNPKQALIILEQFKRMGISLSLDDFGRGYTSLSHLKELPLDEIKIDQYFVRAMREDEKCRMIVKTIIDLSHNMGFRVVAEGIEDAAAMDELIDYRCDSGQGYHLARPLESSRFILLAQEQIKHPESGI